MELDGQREPVAVTAISDADRAAVHKQLGREARAMRRVAHRCGCGLPDVVETSALLEDGTPFPTLFYLTCPRVCSLIGTLEGSGLMKEMTARLAQDPELAADYRRAHDAYLARRDAIAVLPKPVSAGGMPERVKCLHVLVAHALAEGAGINPFGDEVLEKLGDWSTSGPCVTLSLDSGT